MSKAKATSRFRLLQGQDVNASPGEWCSTGRRTVVVSCRGARNIINFDEDVDNSPENDLALNVDHVFEADECDAFDSDVDEGPTTQTMFMTNLTSEDQIYDEAGPSYDSHTPFE
ncbi:hypothetical protein Tco_0562562 [Tanacetum coccineum]